MNDEALTRALLMAGFGMMGNQGSLAQGIARGGMFGMQGYDQALTNADKRTEEEQQRQMRQLQMAQLQAAIEKQQKLAGIMGGGAPASPAPARPSMMDAPSWSANPLNAPQAQPQQQAASIAQKLLAAGFVKEAEDYAKAHNVMTGEDAYGKIDPKDYTPESLRRFMASKNRADLVPRDEIISEDLGGSKIYRTKYDTTPRGKLSKTMTPGEAWTAAQGSIQAGTDPATGQAAFVRVTPQGATPIAGGTPPVKEEQAVIRQAIAQNDVMLNKIDRALALVDEQPGAFGLKNMMGDTVRQRTNPEGVDARAMVADIGSQKLHDRSGAAVTLSEAPRLTPFIPNVNDDAKTIKKKLVQFQNEYTKMRDELAAGRTINQVATPANKAGGEIGKSGLPSIADLQAEALRRQGRG